MADISRLVGNIRGSYLYLMPTIDENNRIIPPQNSQDRNENFNKDLPIKPIKNNIGLIAQILAMVRLQMDESNNDLVHMMLQQMLTIVRTIRENYQMFLFELYLCI